MVVEGLSGEYQWFSIDYMEKYAPNKDSLKIKFPRISMVFDRLSGKICSEQRLATNKIPENFHGFRMIILKICSEQRLAANKVPEKNPWFSIDYLEKYAPN